MKITAEMVRKLQERTRCGMMDCKRAIVKSNGNLDEAEKILLNNPNRNRMVTYKPRAKEEKVKSFAKMLDGRGREYPQFTKEEIEAAKANGFVIVFINDGFLKFEGFIIDETECFNGKEIWFDKNGVFREKANIKGKSSLIVLWDGNWFFATMIPNETFMIYENGEPYCRGIIFSIDDVR